MRARARLLLVLVAAAAGCARNGADGGSGDGSANSDGGVPGDGGSTGGHDLAGDGAGGGDLGSDGRDLLVPAHGVLLGHYYGHGTVAATDARIGRKPAVHLTYFAWSDDWPRESVVADDFATGRIPLVNWEPDSSNGPIDFDQIIAGTYDAMITTRARDVAALGHPFFLDFAAEMNGDEGWGGNNPTRYIAAWRHLHDIFTANGAGNVVWVWAPNVTDIPNGPATMEYYPGDAYVDWTGVDGYNWGSSDPDFAWQSFKEVFADIYPKLAAKGKPILIGEMASDEAGGSKAQWIGDIVGTLKSDYPAIRAFVWFDTDKERHWQIDSSPAALAAYQVLAADPYTNP